MEAGRAAIAWRGRPPRAVLQHPGLVALADQRAAVDAGILRLARPALGPAQVGELQRLVLMAVRARHEVAALVALLVLPLDPRQALGLRGRDQEDLAALEGGRPSLGQQDRIALALDVAGVAVDLVEEQIARRHGAQAHGAVGAGQDQHPAREFLAQSTVLPLSRARRSLTRSRRTSLSSISGSIRCLELRLASSTVGATAIIGPGAWWIT